MRRRSPHRPRLVLLCAAGALAGVAGAPLTHAQQRQMPPAWPYAQTPLPPGEIPPQAAAPKTP